MLIIDVSPEELREKADQIRDTLSEFMSGGEADALISSLQAQYGQTAPTELDADKADACPHDHGDEFQHGVSHGIDIGQSLASLGSAETLAPLPLLLSPEAQAHRAELARDLMREFGEGHPIGKKAQEVILAYLNGTP